MSLSFTLPDDGRSISENIALVQTGNIWKTLVQQIRIIRHYSNNMDNVIKRMRMIGK